jgi:hypothetical protein
MVCPMTLGWPGEPGKYPIRPPGRDGKKIRAWSTAGFKTGAAISKRWRDDVVGGEMLQQLPGEAAA